MEKSIHIGNNIRRLREILGLKQQALAAGMGSGWTQRRISSLEQRETVTPDILEKVAAALGLQPGYIRDFNESLLLEMIRRNPSPGHACQKINTPATTLPGILPADLLHKWLEALEENKKLYERIIALEQEKNALLNKACSAG